MVVVGLFCARVELDPGRERFEEGLRFVRPMVSRADAWGSFL